MERRCASRLPPPYRRRRARQKRPERPDMQATVLAASAAFLSILGGCSFAPTYRTPSSAPPADAYAESGDWQTAQPQDNQSRGAWWEQFGDPQLDALEVKVGDAN